MNKVKVTLSTDRGMYRCKVHNDIPGLLWSEILLALADYAKFEQGIKGTRFDTWLKKTQKAS